MNSSKFSLPHLEVHLRQEPLSVSEEQRRVDIQRKVDMVQKLYLQLIDLFFRNTSNFSIVVIVVIPIIKKLRCQHNRSNQESKKISLTNWIRLKKKFTCGHLTSL